MEETTAPGLAAAIAALRSEAFWEWFASHRYSEDMVEVANHFNEIAAEYLEHVSAGAS